LDLVLAEIIKISEGNKEDNITILDGNPLKEFQV